MSRRTRWMRALRSAVLVGAVLGATSAAAAAQCSEMVEADGLSGYLVGERTITSYHGGWIGMGIIVFRVDTTIGRYQLNNGSAVELVCGRVVRA